MLFALLSFNNILINVGVEPKTVILNSSIRCKILMGLNVSEKNLIFTPLTSDVKNSPVNTAQ